MIRGCGVFVGVVVSFVENEGQVGDLGFGGNIQGALVGGRC